jgi:hypothetical protein
VDVEPQNSQPSAPTNPGGNATLQRWPEGMCLLLGLCSVFGLGGRCLLGGALSKGRIVVGADSDFAFWDPHATWTVDAMQLEHRNKITPFAGRQVLGRVVRTLLRGETIFELNADGLHFSHPAVGFLRWRLGAA